MKYHLKIKISLSIAFVALTSIFFISFFSNFFINRQFKKYVENQQSFRTQEIISSLNNQYNIETDTWNIDSIHTIGMYALYDGFIINVFDSNNNSLWNAQSHDMSLCTQIMGTINKRMTERYPDVQGEFVEQNYDLSNGGQKIGNVSINYYFPFFLNENDFKFLSSLNVILTLIGILSVFLSFAVGFLTSKKVSAPILNTIAAAKNISKGNYNYKISKTDNTIELNDLIDSVNKLADNLNNQEALRKQMSSDIAHELRTPLTTVGTHLEAMICGVWLPTEERLKSCHEEIERITCLVQDIENLYKIENEILKLNKTKINILENINKIAANFEIPILEKNIDLKINGEKIYVLADSLRINQMIFNLLSNAIKYTPKFGIITIEVKKDLNYLYLNFKDNGVGISKEELPFIFERFYRADKSRNRETGGFGIGLTVVKSIINAHDGEIIVESEPDKGSTFKIKLPLGL